MIVPVSTELLIALASEAPAERKATATKPTGKLEPWSATERCRRYVAKCNPAIAGQHGSDVTYRVACAIAKDFNLPYEFGWPILCEYNDRCEPPWSEQELQKKWRDAAESSGERGTALIDNRPVEIAGGGIPAGVGSDTTFEPFAEPAPFDLLGIDGIDFSDLISPGPARPATNGHHSPPAVVATLSPLTLTRSPFDGRVEIEVRDDAEYSTNDLAVASLTLDETLYARGGNLVHVIHEVHSTDGIQRDSGSARIACVALPNIRERLTRVASFGTTKRSKDGTIIREPKNPPEWCYKAVAGRGHWPALRNLQGIVESPIIRPDGSILSQPGYDPSTGLILAPHDNLTLTIPESPTQRDAAVAVAVLCDIVSDFPFEKPEHLAAWLAFTLTIFARHAFSGPAPLFLIDANVRGSGKTMLADAAGMIATGRSVPRMGNPRDDEEARKKITSIALRGDAITVIDNIDGRLGCSQLDSALTGTSWSDRILGGNEMKTMPLLTTWGATGNNVQLSGDMIRRVCHVRLNSPDENPEFRTEFKYPRLIAHVSYNRSSLVSAALTILRGFIISGCPSQSLKPWGSFDGWSELIREAIVWAGAVDPGETRTELSMRSDVSSSGIREFLHGFHDLDPEGNGLTCKEIITRVVQWPDAYSTQHEAIIEICETKDGKLPSTKALGVNLKRFRERVLDGLFLASKISHGGSMKWFVCKVKSKTQLIQTTIPEIDFDIETQIEGFGDAFEEQSGEIDSTKLFP